MGNPKLKGLLGRFAYMAFPELSQLSLWRPHQLRAHAFPRAMLGAL